MRPLKLTMTALGPYKDSEVINFKELGGLRLFVISGATGAGKTTIFDAICFALYGNASGIDRENVTMLRSHFANDDVHTKVELVFEIKGRMYRVLRQIGHIKSGNKSKTGEKYELYEQKGDEEIPCVDRQKVTDINDKIEQLIGLTEDQFKQIVMLPQGEFRKLLTSESENKEEILRRLFNTVKYKYINGFLKEKRDRVIGEYQQQQLQLEQTIHSIRGSLQPFEGSEVFQVLKQEYHEPVQVLHGLQNDMAHVETQIITDERLYNKAFTVHEKEQTKYHEAITLNKRFDEFDQKKLALERMNEEKEAIKEKESHLKKAEQALQLHPYDTQLKLVESELQEKKKHTEKQTEALHQAEKSLIKALEKFETEKNQEATRDKLKIEIQRYKDFLSIVETSAQTKSTLKDMKKHLNQAEKQLMEEKGKRKAQHESILKLKEVIKEQEAKAVRVHELKYKLEQATKHYNLLNTYRKQLVEKKELENKTASEERLYHHLLEQYKHNEKRWLNAQAVILASELYDHNACPVCGSTHHPQPATAVGDEVTKEALENQQKDVEDIKKRYEKVSNELAVLLSEIKGKATDINAAGLDSGTDTLDAQIDKVIEEGHEVRKEHNEAESFHEKLMANKKQLDQLELDQEQLTGKIENAEKSYYANKTEYASLQAGFIEKMRDIPENLQEMSVLKAAITQQKAVLADLNNRWEKAQKTLDNAKEKKQTLSTSVTNAEKQLVELYDKSTQLQAVFDEQLLNKGFSGKAAYEKAKLSNQARELLKQTVEDYQRQHNTLSVQLDELKRELKDKSRVDAKAIKEKLVTLKAQYEAAFEKWNESKQQRDAARKLITQINILSESAANKEKEASIITDLHDVLRGQNDRKISFERYLQIDYLDNIIDAANQRFQELMNGQFYLMRSDRQEAYGKQSGLAIDVFDGYTGQTRDVKTLSGGEKFIASLCLALGMSDVIQSFQGSISIETMFIDEGFGSLDEESLHKSIQALIQLQEGGRLIGVISHVEDLKTIFPAMLQVSKTKDGHSKTNFEIK